MGTVDGDKYYPARKLISIDEDTFINIFGCRLNDVADLRTRFTQVAGFRGGGGYGGGEEALDVSNNYLVERIIYIHGHEHKAAAYKVD